MLITTKGTTLNLTKDAANSVTGKSVFGLGWQGKGGRSLDLDSYIAVLDANNKVLDFIFFGKKSGTGIKHNGDDLTGGGSGKQPNETIEINLGNLDRSATKLIAGLFIYSGGSDLSNVDHAFTNLTDTRGNEFVRYNIQQDFKGMKGVEVAAIEKINGEWIFKALGDGNTMSYDEVKSKYYVGRTMGETPRSSSGSGGGGFFGRLFNLGN